MKTAEVKIAVDIFADDVAQLRRRTDLIVEAIELLGFCAGDVDALATGPVDSARVIVEDVSKYSLRLIRFTAEVPGSAVVEVPWQAAPIKVLGTEAWGFELICSCPIMDEEKPSHEIEIFSRVPGSPVPLPYWQGARLLNVTPPPYRSFGLTGPGEDLPIAWYTVP